MPSPTHGARPRALGAVGAFIVAGTASAGSAWITWDRSPPGTPTEVLLDEAASDENFTAFTITPHGFFIEEVPIEGPRGLTIFHRIVMPSPDAAEVVPEFRTIDGVPRLADCHQQGLPALPFLGELVGFVTDGVPVLSEPEVIDPQNPGDPAAAYFALSSFNGQPVRVIPCQEAMLDCGADEPPPPFTIDQAFYDTWVGDWPAARAVLDPTAGMLTLDVGRVQTNLCRYDPATKTLSVMKQVRIKLFHAGNVLVNELAPKISAELAKIYAQVLNFGKIQTFFKQLVQVNYLILVHDDFKDFIQPLVQSKQASGAVVTVKTIPTDVCQNKVCIGNAIKDFHASCNTLLREPYVLLVGDVDRVPTESYNDPHPRIGMLSTDRPYTLVKGEDKIPDIALARISADDVIQVHNIVAKTVRYLDRPPAGAWPKSVVMACHEEDSPGKYTKNQCAVRGIVAGSALTPTVDFASGANLAAGDNCGPLPFAGNNFIEDALIAGVGTIGYRGHGKKKSWIDWTLVGGGQSFTTDDVKDCDLYLGPCRNPVVWAICCWNGNFDNGADDGIGEWWLQTGGSVGAAAHYGAVVPSRTDVNDDLNREVFTNIYKRGMSVFTLAALGAEVKIIEDHGAAGAHTVMAYEPMGDPQLFMRTAAVPAGGPVSCCAGDIDGNGKVDAADLGLILAAWGQAPACNPATDLNGDGKVDGADLGALLGKWGPC